MAVKVVSGVDVSMMTGRGVPKISHDKMPISNNSTGRVSFQFFDFMGLSLVDGSSFLIELVHVLCQRF